MPRTGDPGQSTSHRYAIFDKAGHQAERLGLSYEKVAEMGYLGAPFTLGQMNRRYEDYVLEVHDEVIYQVWTEDAYRHEYEHRQQQVECGLCSGAGCADCGYTGRALRTQKQIDEDVASLL